MSDSEAPSAWPSRRVALFGRGDDAPALEPAAYPDRYVESVRLRGGVEVLLRPIRPDDEALMLRFHEDLGDESVALRYAGTFSLRQRTDRERLARRCHVDYDREMAIVAEARDAQGVPRLLGIGRLVRVSEGISEFGLVVIDEAQGKGLGGELLERLVRFGREQGLERIEADIAARNRAMQRVAQKLGFEIVYPEEITEPLVRAVLTLQD